MRLRTRILLTSLIVALPVSALVSWAVEARRARDLVTALRGVVLSQINVGVRERCESDPNWFLTGPLDGRPSAEDRALPNPEMLPRPRLTNQVFELFAYTEDVSGSSTASPRIPSDLRRRIMLAQGVVEDTFESDTGTGALVAVWTGWRNSPCSVLVGRLKPPADQTGWRVWLYLGLVVTFFVAGLLVTSETAMRVLRLFDETQASKAHDFSSVAPGPRKDELSAIAFVYNDVVRALQLRGTDVGDREDAMRRFIANAGGQVGEPLAAAERVLADAAADPGRAAAAIRTAAAQVHVAGSRLENLSSTARLRGNGVPPAREPVSLRTAATGAVSRARAAADAAGVSLRVVGDDATVTGDRALFERAIGNLVDNAIAHSRAGAAVTVSITRDPVGGFALRVTDTGAGVSEEELRGLSAIRRFRGDEGGTGDRGVAGLGLALAREVAERAGLQMELRRPPAGGFEVVWTGSATSSSPRPPATPDPARGSTPAESS